MLTTVQDWPGRIGYWHIGVPPSGPMDDLSFRIGNRRARQRRGRGRPRMHQGRAGVAVPRRRHGCASRARRSTVTVDGVAVPQWQSVTVAAGGVLDVGMLDRPGMRCYVLVAGGLASSPNTSAAQPRSRWARSAATRAARCARATCCRRRRSGPARERPDRAARAAIDEQPSIGHRWEIAVTEGPHGAPEFFTRADIDTAASAPTTPCTSTPTAPACASIGPKPQWARTDGGEAGLHPSNIHDTAYCVGALDFTGDTPILLGPDGPSLGGFVCPVTVVGGDRWKLGQMAPGDAVRFVPVRADRAPSLRTIDIDRRASFPLVISTSQRRATTACSTRFAAADGTAVT